MTDFIRDLTSHLGPRWGRRISQAIGVNADLIQELIRLVAPLILSGLKRQKEEHGGMDRVDHILNRHGSDLILHDLDVHLTGKLTEKQPDSSLGGLLGPGGYQAAELLAHRYNLDGNRAARIIPVLGPVVMGFLSHLRKQSGIGLCGVSAILDRESDINLLDDIPGFFMRDDQRVAENRDVLAELLKGLTAAIVPSASNHSETESSLD